MKDAGNLRSISAQIFHTTERIRLYWDCRKSDTLRRIVKSDVKWLRALREHRAELLKARREERQ